MRPKIVVVYDDGAARPAHIAVGLTKWADCVFVIEPNKHNLAMQPLLEQLGPVLLVDPARPVVDLARAHKPDGLVTYSERALNLAARVAEQLCLPFHSPRVCEALTDKWKQRAILDASGVDTVRCHRIESPSEWSIAVAAVGLPGVLKPARGGGGRNTFLVNEVEQGRRLATEVLGMESPGLTVGGTLVFEEYLEGRNCRPFGDYVSVESLVIDGRVHDLAVSGKLPTIPPFRETGRFWPSPLETQEERQVRDLARRAVEALGVRIGLTHTELRLTPAGPRIIEVNGRIGGGIYDFGRQAAGVDLIETTARLAMGSPVAIPPFYRGNAHFHFWHCTPRRPGTFLGVDGVEQVKSIPGVTLYRPQMRPGHRFAGDVQTQEMDMVIGSVGDVREIPQVVEKTDAALRFRFSFDTGELEVNGAELGQL
jgi:predicted ATP-grasp superfamily ATP-dependent carboligase